MYSTSGLHHLTAIASDPQRNLDFYAGTLGLRFVKQTVNFDDPGTYHLYYGDASGRPGSILTFFPWPNARRGRIGAGQVGETQLAIPTAAVAFWIQRLTEHQVAFTGPTRRFDGETVLTFTDHDGMPLALVATAAAASLPGWSGGPGVPEAMSIRGMHAVTLFVHRLAETAAVLTGALGYREVSRRDGIARYAVGDGAPGDIVDVQEWPTGPGGTGGAGTVHHVAFRAADDATEFGLRAQVSAIGLPITEQIDRTYFRSMYFREPGHVLFELATDAPGFTVDESADALGDTLQLPAQHEHLRSALLERLPSLHRPGVEAPTT
ncbi:MAG TPA: ring-cleaving dioxygenase [Gemmatimonadaceae bacterium]|nr:ring-cleaving dioxygenase [Gemmatimonadaceae bacterium]